jgi:prephenate dehydrogenase
MAPPRRAGIVGIGLIGGSIGLALRAQGWHVTGTDRDAGRAARALELGAIDAIGSDPAADVTFVATPVGAIPAAVREALATTAGLVTDVGSVKSAMVELMDDPRYVGGHPMAGSELERVDRGAPTCSRGRPGCSRPRPAPTTTLQRAARRGFVVRRR